MHTILERLAQVDERMKQTTKLTDMAAVIEKQVADIMSGTVVGPVVVGTAARPRIPYPLPTKFRAPDMS